MNNLKKYSPIIMGVGIVCLVVSIALFIALAVSLGAFEDTLGSKPTAEEAKKIIEEAEQWAEMFDSKITDFVDVSEFEMMIFKVSASPLRIVLLVIGLLLLGIGAVIQFVKMDGAMFDNAKESISSGVAYASSAVKKAVEFATVKCPSCGKVCAGKTTFCPACGEKMIKPEISIPSVTAAKPEVCTCTNCGKKYSEKHAFCPACGCKISDKDKNYCGVSEEEKVASVEVYVGGETEVIPTEVEESVGFASEVMPADRTETKATSTSSSATEDAVIVHRSSRGSSEEAAKPSVTAVTEKKNPFMSKPKGL